MSKSVVFLLKIKTDDLLPDDKSSIIEEIIGVLLPVDVPDFVQEISMMVDGKEVVRRTRDA